MGLKLGCAIHFIGIFGMVKAPGGSGGRSRGGGSVSTLLNSQNPKPKTYCRFKASGFCGAGEAGGVKSAFGFQGFKGFRG